MERVSKRENIIGVSNTRYYSVRVVRYWGIIVTPLQTDECETGLACKKDKIYQPQSVLKMRRSALVGRETPSMYGR